MELWDVVDKAGKYLGKQIRRGEKLPRGEYHLVVHAWIKNKKGEFLISKRAENKTHPLLWETTGGSALTGEDSLTAVVREIEEEVGLRVKKENGRKIYHSIYETECSYINDIWLFEEDFLLEDVSMQEEEVCDVKIVTLDEIKRLIEQKKFIPSKWVEVCIAILSAEEIHNKISQGRNMIKDGRESESIQVFQKLLKTYPESAEVHLNAAFTYDNLGEEKLAIPLYEKALSIGLVDNHEKRDCYVCLASSYRVIGELDKSYQYLQQAKNEFGNDSVINAFLSLTLLDLKEYENAIKLLGMTLLNETRNADLQNYSRALRTYFEGIEA